MCEVAHKEGWAPKIRWFWNTVLEKTLESPLENKEIKQDNSKGNHPEYSLEGLMLKFQNSGHLMQTANSLEKTLMMGKIEGRRRRGRQRMKQLDGITDSNGHEFEQTSQGDGEGQWSLSCCSTWGCKEPDMTATEQQQQQYTHTHTHTHIQMCYYTLN